MNSLLEFITAPVQTIREKVMARVGVGGFSVVETVRANRANTRRAHIEIAQRAARNNWSAETLDFETERMQRTRARHTLSTHRNIGSAVRGYGRSLLTIGRTGRYYNVGTLDGRTTHVCASYMGQSWPKPYSAIPEKPPRLQRVIHPCRSYLEFRESPPVDTRDFIQIWNDSTEALRLELLGPVRYAAYLTGALVINSYIQFETAVLLTLEELGINDDEDENGNTNQ